MNLLKKFWQDEAGLVMSAELVMLGTVGVLGATVGLSAAATSVNEEMVEFSHAIRQPGSKLSCGGASELSCLDRLFFIPPTRCRHFSR